MLHLNSNYLGYSINQSLNNIKTVKACHSLISLMEKDSRFQPNKQTILKGGTLIYSTSVLHSALFPIFCNEEKTYVGTEMAVAILLSRLAVARLIVLKQLDEAIASLMAQLKYGQAE